MKLDTSNRGSRIQSLPSARAKENSPRGNKGAGDREKQGGGGGDFINLFKQPDELGNYKKLGIPLALPLSCASFALPLRRNLFALSANEGLGVCARVILIFLVLLLTLGREGGREAGIRKVEL